MITLLAWISLVTMVHITGESKMNLLGAVLYFIMPVLTDVAIIDKLNHRK